MSASAGTTLIPECTAFRCSHYMPAQMLIAQWQTIKTLSCTPYTGLRRQNALPLNVEIRYQLADARAHGHQNDPGIRTVHLKLITINSIGAILSWWAVVYWGLDSQNRIYIAFWDDAHIKIIQIQFRKCSLSPRSR